MIEVNIGSAPWDEDCARIGQENYTARTMNECAVFMRQIERYYPVPSDSSLCIEANRHDFGTYYEVVAKGDSDWAFAVEQDQFNKLKNWDRKAMEELGLIGI